MKIYHNQVQQTLTQHYPLIWLIFGDEPWQKMDAITSIKQAAKKKGFDEHIHFHVDEKFNWDLLANEYQAMSLFAQSRIIEVELMTNKIGDAGSKLLISLADQINPDNLLIIHGAKLDGPSLRKKWVKSLQANGCYLPIYELEGRALQQWLQRQAKQLNLSLAPDVTPLLIELFEGNITALAQELNKLHILFGSNPISLADAESIITKQAKFNPFQLIDAMLMGDLSRCIKVLSQLQQEGTASGQLIWFLFKELKQLLAMKEALVNGQEITQLFQSYRIWDKRKPLYQSALQQSSLESIKIAISRLSQVDLISKTSGEFDTFILLADICACLRAGQLLTKFPLDYEYSVH